MSYYDCRIGRMFPKNCRHRFKLGPFFVSCPMERTATNRVHMNTYDNKEVCLFGQVRILLLGSWQVAFSERPAVIAEISLLQYEPVTAKVLSLLHVCHVEGRFCV